MQRGAQLRPKLGEHNTRTFAESSPLHVLAVVVAFVTEAPTASERFHAQYFS
jgi:hypothetical protein